jgi:nucleoside triphosphate pyrophosphatase
LGTPFEVRAPEVEELESGPPHEVAVENAYRKAHAVSEQGVDGRVLGADTVVALGGTIYGKPADRAEARTTLEALSGRRHTVIGGLCLIASDRRPRTAAATTAVTFRVLNEGLLEWYLDTGEWRDRAGAYAIQGRGAALVRSIEGDYLNVVGLPVGLLMELEPELITAP